MCVDKNIAQQTELCKEVSVIVFDFPGSTDILTYLCSYVEKCLRRLNVLICTFKFFLVPSVFQCFDTSKYVFAKISALFI